MLIWRREGGKGKVGLVRGEADLRSNSAGVQVANSQLARIRAAGAVAQRHVLLARLPQLDGGPNVCGIHRCWDLDQHASQMCPLSDEETYRTRGIVIEIGWISVGVDGYCASKQARESKTCHQVLHHVFRQNWNELGQWRIDLSFQMNKCPKDQVNEGIEDLRNVERREHSSYVLTLATHLLISPAILLKTTTTTR